MSPALLLFTCLRGHACTLTVETGAVARPWEIVSADIPAPAPGIGVRLFEAATGRAVPCQQGPSPEPGRTRLTWVAHDLQAGEERVYFTRLEPEDVVGLEPRGVRIDRSQEGEGQLDLAVGGDPFLTYRFGPEFGRPFCFPLLGPHGEAVTRAFPIRTDVPGESTDHTHHLSFWFAFGAVNGVDCWAAGGKTVHRAFEAIDDGPVYARIRSVDDWTDAQGRKLMEDTREVRVHALGLPLRVLDFEITLRASEGDVTLGDTKEGMFALRPASTMEVARGLGGRIENSRGGVNEKETWGKRAEWCDYSGPVGDAKVGLAILDHPANFRHPTYWMVRDYGLFACNPFGVRAYTGDPTQDGSYAIPAGGELTFRYRVLVHEGDAAQAGLADLWAAYATPATVSVSCPEAFDGRVPEGYALAFEDDFEHGADAWQPREGNRWEVVELPDGGHGYQLMEPGKQRELRAPGGLSLIREHLVGDFVLTARAKCLTPSTVRGRDVVVALGYRDPTHFCYVHFSNASDPIHNAVCLVDGAPRVAITGAEPTAARLTTDGFHALKVTRVGKRIEASIDDMTTPVMYAEDERLGVGQVGLGSFDDTAVFDDVRLYVPRG